MAEDSSSQWHPGFRVIVATCNPRGSCMLQVWAPNHWHKQRCWDLKEFARDPRPVYAVLLKTLQWCLFWSCNFPPDSHWPVWKNKIRRVFKMDDTGSRDQKFTCVSKGFSMVGNLVLASEDSFVLHSLSQEAIFVFSSQYRSYSCRISGK